MLNLEIISERATTLAGHDQGVAARQKLNLNQLDAQPARVQVMAYDQLEAISTSFFQGLFAGSLNKLGEQSFLKKYDFSHLPEHLRLDVNLGLRRLKMKRKIAGA